jgi:pilus assembly protein Flp/PilA
LHPSRDRSCRLSAIIRFLRDTRRATAIEYGLIAVVVIGAVSNVGTKLSTTFTTVSSKIK